MPSTVWDSFEKLENGYVKCKICFKKLTNKGGSTSSMTRQFSAAGNIVNAKRSALQADKVNQLVFLSKINKN